MAVPTFFSYAYEDRDLAGHIKQRFEIYGFNVFLAHGDIEPAMEWQDEILQYLRTCEVFLALLTEAFDESNWAHQEVGIAYARNPRPIMVPINAGRGPVGFLARYQAIRINPEKAEKPAYLNNTCLRIVRSIVQENAPIAEEIRRTIISEIGSIASYDDAGAVFSMLEEINGITPDEINRALAASSENPQVYESRSAHLSIRSLIETHKKNIKKTVLNEFYKFWKYAPVAE